MRIKKVWGKKVIIESADGKIFRGKVTDYIYPEDNENDKESIIVDAIGHLYPYEFYEDDIIKIEIIE
ncbi:hypothetical protein M0R79_06065 [Ignavigranum ruoffiae]|uniref:hypothetical protein n=1 Tax=Ignavigranum ruoffiae TaxID=89093 RepID=UPI00204D4ED4|nr:hypothetical protein [Ignavigranum ruoffiae]UPQ85221.1 hypothetical protein M0R79_06065 [Ignavigranum ruoffiae]